MMAVLLSLILLGGERDARVPPDDDRDWNPRNSSGRDDTLRTPTFRGLEARPAPLVKKATGLVTWYGENFHGRTMANGDIFDMYDPTLAASKDWPLGTRLRVSHQGRSIEVVVSDRGAFTHELDLSQAAFELLAPLSRGMIEVEIVLCGS